MLGRRRHLGNEGPALRDGPPLCAKDGSGNRCGRTGGRRDGLRARGAPDPCRERPNTLASRRSACTGLRHLPWRGGRMKPIERGEILGLADYETIRERFRARVIAEKKLRRVHVGPNVSALFENRDTVLLQIQEMLRTERITRPAAVDHEIDTYNESLPGDNQLSCTVMIEIPDTTERDAFLRA